MWGSEILMIPKYIEEESSKIGNKSKKKWCCNLKM
jgi:hypothetical protein